MSIENESDDRGAEAVPAYVTPYLSVEEYLKLEAQTPIRHEYVDGEMFAMSAPMVRHGIICANVFTAIFNHARGGPCRAFIGELKVGKRAGRPPFFYHPDIAVVCGKLDPDALYVEESKLIVEVLSPSTERLDRYEKARNYQQLETLEEYVLIAQERCEVTIQRRESGWARSIVSSREHAMHFRSVDLTLPFAEIYEGLAMPSAAA